MIMDKKLRLPDDVLVEIKMKPVGQLLKDKGLTADGSVQMFHTQNVLRRIIKYMPKVTGMTIKVTIAQTDIRRPEIVTNTPYAKMLFYGIVMVDPETGAAGFKTNQGTWRSRKGVPKVPSGRRLTYNTTKNAHAGPRWDLRLSSAEGKKLVAELQSYINRRAGI